MRNYGFHQVFFYLGLLTYYVDIQMVKLTSFFVLGENKAIDCVLVDGLAERKSC